MLEELNGMWQTAHDMCSLSAYHAAFTDCKEGDVYDPSESASTLFTFSNTDRSIVVVSPGTVWQLIGLTNWVLDFLERLMKECVLFGEQPAGTEREKADGDDDDDLFGSTPCERTPGPELTLGLNNNPAQKQPPIPNIMLHLVHPVGCATLRNILPHIRLFRTFLSSRPPSSEVLQMADDVLIDMIERSGIDLSKLEPLITQQMEDIQSFSGHSHAENLHHIDD